MALYLGGNKISGNTTTGTKTVGIKQLNNIVYQKTLTEDQSSIEVTGLDIIRDGGHYQFELISQYSVASQLVITINNAKDTYFRTHLCVQGTTNVSNGQVGSLTPAGGYTAAFPNIQGYLYTSTDFFPQVTTGDIWFHPQNTRVAYSIEHQCSVASRHSYSKLTGVMGGVESNVTSIQFGLRETGLFRKGATLIIRKVNTPEQTFIGTNLDLSITPDINSNEEYAVPNCKTIRENIENYSTTEKRIGKWVDGRPIYQKSLTFTSTSSALITGLTSIQDVIDINVVVKASASMGNGWRKIPWLYPASSTDWDAGVWLGEDGKLNLQFGNSIKNITRGIVIIKYTKSTDEVGVIS